jgi:hypothetical protein
MIYLITFINETIGEMIKLSLEWSSIVPVNYYLVINYFLCSKPGFHFCMAIYMAVCLGFLSDRCKIILINAETVVENQ